MKERWIGGGSRVFRVRVADTFASRFRGLMGRRSLEPGEGLLLVRCGSIHCCFMRFPIDAVYLDRELRIVGVETVRPWRMGGRFSGARHVLEVGEDCARDWKPGDTLSWKEPEGR